MINFALKRDPKGGEYLPVGVQRDELRFRLGSLWAYNKTPSVFDRLHGVVAR